MAMGQAITDPMVRALLKTTYESGVANAKFQLSTFLTKLNKDKWSGGKELKYACNYADGGNVGAAYDVLVRDPGSFGDNAEWTMTQGFTHTFFNIDQPELLNSKNDKAAYMSVLANKMESAFSRMSRALATYIHGTSSGVYGKVKTAPSASISASNNTMKVDLSTAMKMPRGTRFAVISGGIPNIANMGTAVYTVTARDTSDTSAPTITFSTTTPGETIAVGDLLVDYTAINSDGTTNAPDGLLDLIPSWGDRTGSDWQNYITTPFRGINRSLEVESLAGQFVKYDSSADYPIAHAIMDLLMKTTIAGGQGNTLLMNSYDYDRLCKELKLVSNLRQVINGAPDKTGVNLGLDEFRVAFNDAVQNKLIIDAYACNDLIYSLPMDKLSFYDVGNVSRVIIPQEFIGKHDVESVGEQGFGNNPKSELNIDDVFSVVPGAVGRHSEQMRISAHVQGNLMLKDTTSAGVAKIA